MWVYLVTIGFVWCIFDPFYFPGYNTNTIKTRVRKQQATNNCPKYPIQNTKIRKGDAKKEREGEGKERPQFLSLNPLNALIVERYL